MGKINAAWHKAHKMPKNPTHEERMDWHREHAKHCQCWPIPAKLLEEMRKPSHKK